MRWSLFFLIFSMVAYVFGIDQRISYTPGENQEAITNQVLQGTLKEVSMQTENGLPGSSLFVQPTDKRGYWPTREWRTKSLEEVGLDPVSIQRMEEYAFQRSAPESDRAGIRTDGVVIIKDGYLVYEHYAGGFDAEQRHLIWSASKSVTNAIYGTAVQDGFIELDDPAFRHYPALDREEARGITINHLLRMSSGLFSNESYESSPLESTVNTMLFSFGHRDMGFYAASQPVIASPDKHWEYSSLTSTLLMAILRNVMDADTYDEYLWSALFEPLGMRSVVFERDVAGTFVGSSYAFMTPRDMVRFGFLFLNDGVWEDQQILAKDWVQYSTTVAPAMQTTELSEEELKEGTYGAQWWLNRSVPEWGIPSTFPDAPEDLFYASGHWGQAIFIIPSLDLVIAYTADNRDDSFDYNQFLKLILEGVTNGRNS